MTAATTCVVDFTGGRSNGTAPVCSLDRRRYCAKIRVVAVAVMEVRMLPPGQESRDD